MVVKRQLPLEFRHDGSDFAPSYQVAVANDKYTTSSSSAQISFTEVYDVRKFTMLPASLNPLSSVALTRHNFDMSTSGIPLNQLVFTAVHVKHGRIDIFYQRELAGHSLTRFRYSDLVTGRIHLVSTSDEEPPVLSCHATDEQLKRDTAAPVTANFYLR